MKQNPKITLSMIVKNEEKYLDECLNSVKEAVDQILIVDTGSTDNTVEIAKRYNADIYNFKWIDDFSAARNFALSKSKGEWILYLDADERLSSKSLRELNEITKSDALLGCRCLVISVDEKNNRPNYMHYTRLFHNHPEIKFTGRIHEQIEDSLIGSNFKIIDTNIEIIHIGYSISKNDLKQKAERNLKILKEEFERNNSSYNAFQIANTYTALEEYEKAKEYYKLSVVKKDLKKEYMSFSYLNLSGYEFGKHNLVKAAEYLESGIKNDASNPLLNLLASEISFRKNEFKKSLKYCKQALLENRKILLGKSESSFSAAVKNERIICKGIYYSFLSSGKKELDFFLNELEKENSSLSDLIQKIIHQEKISIQELKDIINADNLDTFLNLIESYKDKKVALRIIRTIENLFSGNSKYLKTLGLLYFENKMYDEAAESFEHSLSLNEKDPSSVFYLVSLYLEKNCKEKIPSLLNLAEKEFGRIPEFNEKFKILKEKLKATV